MPTPFKEQVNATSVRRLGEAVAAQVRGFDVERFVAAGADGLDAFELKARTVHVGQALGAALPVPFTEAAPAVARAVDDAALDGWTAWPVTEWIALAGLDDPFGEVLGDAPLRHLVDPTEQLGPGQDGGPALEVHVGRRSYDGPAASAAGWCTGRWAPGVRPVGKPLNVSNPTAWLSGGGLPAGPPRPRLLASAGRPRQRRE